MSYFKCLKQNCKLVLMFKMIYRACFKFLKWNCKPILRFKMRFYPYSDPWSSVVGNQNTVQTRVSAHLEQQPNSYSSLLWTSEPKTTAHLDQWPIGGYMSLQTTWPHIFVTCILSTLVLVVLVLIVRCNLPRELSGRSFLLCDDKYRFDQRPRWI